jgi:RNA polymerase sigma factor (sigma-70 family)
MSEEDKILEAFERNDESILRDLSVLANAVARKMRLPSYLEPCDVAQDALAIVVESLRSGKFRGDSNLKTFAYRVTVNICLYKNRELQRMESTDIDPDSTQSNQLDPESSLLDKERRFLAFRVLRRLPAKCLALFNIMFKEHKDYKAIAQLQGVKEVTVRERMSACRKMARELAVALSQ